MRKPRARVRSMLRFTEPTTEAVTVMLTEQNRHGLTYQDVGAAPLRVAPEGWRVNRHRECVGQGEDDFLTAKDAFRRWEHIDGLNWIKLQPPEAELTEDEPVAIVASVFGLIWWANACRIVYLVDEEDGPITRFGLGYGTLPNHAARGEELFLLEWDRRTGKVWYEIFSFSRPRALLARLFSPYLRYRQRRFARESVQVIREVIQRSSAHAMME